MKKTLLILAMILVAIPAAAQKGFSTVEERMTGKEFTDAGLDKLTDEELAALNDWLRSHSVATLENAQEPRGDIRGFEGRAGFGYDDQAIVSRIVGTFTGWDGETLFRLENGMVWKQDEAGRFHTRAMENPVVTIDKGLLSSWYMQVEGYNKELRVERIE